MKGLRSRAVWVGIVLTILGVLQVFAVNFPIRPLYQGLFSAVIGILIVLIRYDTTG